MSLISTYLLGGIFLALFLTTVILTNHSYPGMFFLIPCFMSFFPVLINIMIFCNSDEISMAHKSFDDAKNVNSEVKLISLIESESEDKIITTSSDFRYNTAGFYGSIFSKGESLEAGELTICQGLSF